MRIQGITIEVSNPAVSKDVYENALGFAPGEYYAPTKWQPFDFGDQYFAIREVDDKKPHDDLDITNVELDDVEGVLARVKDSADVAEPLAETPYGRYKFGGQGSRRLPPGVRSESPAVTLVCGDAGAAEWCAHR